jgi:hypothetical protein
MFRPACFVANPGGTSFGRFFGFRSVHVHQVEYRESAEHDRRNDGGGLYNPPKQAANQEAPGVTGGNGSIKRKRPSLGPFRSRRAADRLPG